MSPDLNVKYNVLFVLQKDVEMVMKNNAFLRLPVSEAAKTPWDTFAAEPRDAVWRNFDASFKGILTSGGDKTYSHRAGRRVPNPSQPGQVTSMLVHRSYLSSRKAKPSLNSC